MKSKIVTFFNEKGGVGKTTASINLSYALTVKNKKVLLIDFDPQASATKILRKKSSYNLYDVLKKTVKLEDIKISINDSLDFVPADKTLKGIEEILGEEKGINDFKDILEKEQEYYDYIIIDSPPNFGKMSIASVVVNSLTIVPVIPDRMAINGLINLIDTMNRLRKKTGLELKYMVLINIADIRTKITNTYLELLKNKFGKNVFKTYIHRNTDVQKAQDLNISLFEYDKNCKAAKDYMNLAKEVLNYE